MKGFDRGLPSKVPQRLHRLVPYDMRADMRRRVKAPAPGDLEFEEPVPACAPDETTGPPDIVHLGAANAGSLWWFGVVADHPEVRTGPSAVATARYFSRYCTEPFGPTEVERFHRLFPRPPHATTAYWCPDGLVYEWITPLLVEAAPAMVAVVMVRDPIERLRADLAAGAERAVNHVGSALADAVDRGRYGDQLRRLMASVPAERILVLQYERCLVDPLGEAARTYRALGLDDGHRARTLGRHPVGDPPDTYPLDADVTTRLRELYLPDVRELVDLVPGLDPSLWPNFVDPW